VIDLLVWAAALLVAGATGAVVLRVLRAMPADDVERALVMLAVGLGVWGTFGLVFAARHTLRQDHVLVLGMALLIAGVWSFGTALRGAWRRVWAGPSWACALTAALFAAMVLAAMAPPVSGDQTKYQLAYPKLYAEAGGLVPTPWTFWGQQQFLQNFLFAVAYAVRGERLALLLNVTWVPLAAAAQALLVERYLWRGAGAAAAALLVTMPMTWSLGTKGGSDLALVAYTTLAVTGLLEWRRGGDGGTLRRTALLAGLAGGTKVMGLLTPGLVGAFVLLAWAPGRRSGRVRLGAAGVFGAIVLAAAAPPYVRNLVETGNPLHPFGAGVFPSAHWSAAAGSYLNEYYEQYRSERSVRRAAEPYRGWEVARFPWDLTMAPESFERAARGSLDVGPFALALLPGALVLAWRRRAAAWVLGIGAAYVLVIAVGAWAHPRYVFPGVVLVSAVAVAGAGALLPRWFGPLVAVTLAGHLAVTARLIWPEFPHQVRAAVGLVSRDEFLAAESARYRFWRRACSVIGTRGLAFVLEKIPHPYFMECPVVLASYLEQQLVDYRSIATPGDLDAAARRLGATHVVVSQDDLGRHADPYETRVTALWRAWIGGLGAPQLEQDAYALYVLPPPRSAR
jgi:hypothetical protein